VVGSPPQASSTARQAPGIVVIVAGLPEPLRPRVTGRRDQKDSRSRMNGPGGWWAGCGDGRASHRRARAVREHDGGRRAAVRAHGPSPAEGEQALRPRYLPRRRTQCVGPRPTFVRIDGPSLATPEPGRGPSQRPGGVRAHPRLVVRERGGERARVSLVPNLVPKLASDADPPRSSVRDRQPSARLQPRGCRLRQLVTRGAGVARQSRLGVCR
jgi:hypothetical protein